MSVPKRFKTKKQKVYKLGSQKNLIKRNSFTKLSTDINFLTPREILKKYLLMAQKSLPILNKVGTSMVWYTTFFFKYYKWLSSQNTYLLYFFNKLYVYIDFIFSKLLWLTFYTTNLYYYKKSKVRNYLRRHRFYKPLTTYLINIGVKFLLVSIHYRTSLETFQELNKSRKTIEPKSNQPLKNKLSMSFYRVLNSNKKIYKRYKKSV